MHPRDYGTEQEMRRARSLAERVGSEMVLTVVMAVFGLWLVTYPLADLIFHHAQLGAFHGTDQNRHIALTFDDGPDQDTRAILNELARLEVRATFFVVAERAREHPELIRQIVQAGHDLGLHGRVHRSAYWLSPWTSFRSLRTGVSDLVSITGLPVRWYRPPWGHHSLWIWWACRRLGLTRVLWTVAPNDWKSSQSPERIASHVVRSASPGAVVVLHDGGGSRQRTCTALDRMVTELRQLGLAPSPLSSMGAQSWGLRVIWRWWETHFSLAWEVDAVPSADGGLPMYRLGRIRYRGHAVDVRGTRIQPGDWFGEVHFDNTVLSAFSAGSSQGLKAYRAAQRGMRDLALFVGQGRYAAVQSFGGITVLDAGQAIERLGFQRIAIRGWQLWSMWVYLMVLMAVYHRAGWSNLRRYAKLRPVLLVIDRTTLLARYGLQRSNESMSHGSGS